LIATIAAGMDDAINNILGLPFIIAMKKIVEFVDMIAMFNAINHPPFPIKLQITSNTVPTLNGKVNVSAHADKSVLAQLEHYEQWRSGQIAPCEGCSRANTIFLCRSFGLDPLITNACNNITINGRLPLAPVIAILGHKGHDNEQNAIIISPHLHNPPACPSSILLLDRGKFDAAAFNSMLVDCYMRWVLF
jgi:hypothetical protein